MALYKLGGRFMHINQNQTQKYKDCVRAIRDLAEAEPMCMVNSAIHEAIDDLNAAILLECFGIKTKSLREVSRDD